MEIFWCFLLCIFQDMGIILFFSCFCCFHLFLSTLSIVFNAINIITTLKFSNVCFYNHYAFQPDLMPWLALRGQTLWRNPWLGIVRKVKRAIENGYLSLKVVCSSDVVFIRLSCLNLVNKKAIFHRNQSAIGDDNVP